MVMLDVNMLADDGYEAISGPMQNTFPVHVGQPT
jgi:hypothetical protein